MTMLVIAFLLGLVVGGVIIVTTARAGNARWIWRGRGSGPSSGVASYGASLERKLHLGLDLSQRDSISAIWCRQQTATDSLRQQLRGPMDSLFQLIRPAVETRRLQTRTEIRALLTPPAQERYDSMNRADDEQRKKLRDQGPLPGGSGPCTGSAGGPGPRGGFDRGSY